jgi:hypothetical protein
LTYVFERHLRDKFSEPYRKPSGNRSPIPDPRSYFGA